MPTDPTNPTENRPANDPPDPLHPGSGPMHVKRAPEAPGAVSAPDTDDELKMPHERDQSAEDSTAKKPDAHMVQAKKDLDAGQMDTDMRAVPGLDAERRAKAVGGAGGANTPPSDADS
jgi:hypothetical protein